MKFLLVFCFFSFSCESFCVENSFPYSSHNQEESTMTDWILGGIQRPVNQVILGQAVTGIMFMSIGTYYHFQCEGQEACVRSSVGLPMMITGGGLIVSMINRGCNRYIEYMQQLTEVESS